MAGSNYAAITSCERSGWTIRPVGPAQVGWIGETIKPLLQTDFLGRPAAQGRQRIWAASDGGRIAGLVSAAPWAFLVFRDAWTLRERLEVDAEVRYPVLPTHRPAMAVELLNVALRELESLGCEQAYLDLPADSHGPRDVVERMGFERIGLRVDAKSEVVYVKPLKPDLPRKSLFDFARGAAVRSTASAADAPRPDGDFWMGAPVYSGFSGYPHLGGLLDRVVPDGCRSFLSIPCATGDALRWLGRPRVERLAGLDLNPVALELARARLAVPQLDEVNIALAESFLADLRREPNDLARLIDNVVRALNPSHAGADDDALDQLRAAWKFGAGASDAVSDHWIAMKGMVELAGRPRGVHPLAALARMATRPEAARELGRQANARGRRTLPGVPSRPVLLTEANLLAGEVTPGAEAYDCVFCFEALLMFFAAGRQQEFLDALLAHLGRPGRLVLTGIDAGRRLPRELRWAAHELAGRGLIVRAGRYVPRPVSWAIPGSVRPFPFITADYPES